MNFLKNLLLSFALFIGALVALNYAGIVDIKAPGLFEGWFKNNSAITGSGDIYTGESILVNGIQVKLCEGTLRPHVDPITKEVTCIPSLNLEAQCIGPDGEAYDNGTKKTFYRNAEKTETNTRPKCESLEKKCTDGKFVVADSTSTGTVDEDQYAFFTCYTIDRTNQETKTCEGDNGLEYVVGSTRIRFLESAVVADAECKSIQEYCNADGKWISKFPTYTMATCDFKGAFSPQFTKENTGKIFTGEAQLTDAAQGKLIVDSSKAECTLPWGERILHGEKILSFKEKVVKFDEECISRVNTCVDGDLEFVDPYPYDTCTIQGPESCKITETDVTIAHGSQKLLYKKGATVNGQYECEEQTRSCYNGTLDGDISFMYTTCNKPKPVESTNKCPNPYVGDTRALDHGWEGVGYYDNTVSLLESCDGVVNGKMNKVALKCEYGSIQPIGNGVKLRKSCAKGSAKACTTPWGAKVEHGANVLAFKSTNVGYGGECISETRICQDGTLGGSFQYASCAQTSASSCTTPWGSIISHGQNVQAFQSEIVPYGTNCIPETRVCGDGKLAGSFIFRSCTQEAPKDCTYNGANVKHGQIIARYKEPQVVGQVADGTDQCVRYTATCTNGTLQGSLMSHPEAVYVQCTTTIPNNGSN